MLNLKSAIRYSKKLGRSSEDVKLVGTKTLEKERYANLTNPSILRSKAKGTTQNYRCEIVYKSDPYKCKVFCECADFKFTFYSAVNEAGGLSRRIPATDFPQNKGTGVVRAVSKPGLCKHLLALAETL